MDEITTEPTRTKVRVHMGIQLSDHQIVIDRSTVPSDISHADVLREVANQLDMQEGKPASIIVPAYGN